jgi:MarR family transcriptional regulator, lower aerobic nicotinate degradation pathway regulator
LSELILNDELSKRLNYLIRRMHQTADAYFLEETQPFDVTPVQPAALRAIELRPGVDQLRLGRAVRLDRTTIAGVVKRLETKGLILRQESPRDRRSNLLQVTEAGKSMLAELIPAADRAQRRMLAKLQPAERKQLMELMVRLIDDGKAARSLP